MFRGTQSGNSRISSFLVKILALSLLVFIPSQVFLPSLASASSGGISWWWITQPGNTDSNLTIQSPSYYKTNAYSTCNQYQINFNWGNGGPYNGVNAGCNQGNQSTSTGSGPGNALNTDGFSTYGEGWIQLPRVTGTITFCSQSDDGFMLYINSNGNFDQSSNLISNWIQQGNQTGQNCNATGSITTSASGPYYPGGYYPIQVFHHENTGGAVAMLLWSYSGQSSYVLVPAGNLFNSAPQNVVTFNSNYPASGSPSVASVTQGNSSSSVTLATQGTMVAPTGYTFAGWNTATDGSGTNYAAGASYAPSGSVTLYAQWNATISINTNGATSGAASATSITQTGVQSTITIPFVNTLTRAGYTFNGWNTAADGSGTSYAAGSAATPNLSVATTLYAQWASVITYNINSGAGTTPSSVTVPYGTAINLPTGSGMSMSGKYFAGWYTNNIGTGGTLTQGLLLYTPTGNITLYALWASPIAVSGNSTYTAFAGVASRSDTHTVSGGVMAAVNVAATNTIMSGNPSITIDSSTANSYVFVVPSTLAPGSYTETVMSMDALSANLWQTTTIVVASAIKFSPTTQVLNVTAGTGGSATIAIAANTGTGTKNITRTVGSSAENTGTSWSYTPGASSGSITVTTGLAAGTYTDTFKASDSSAYTSTLTLTINVSPAITFAYPNSTTPSTSGTYATTAGAGGSYGVIFGQNGTGPLSFSQAVSPTASGITIDTSTGSNQVTVKISTLVPAGTYYDTITATDTATATSKYVTTITVNPALSLSAAPASLTMTAGTSGSIVVTASGGSGGNSFLDTHSSSSSPVVMTSTSTSATLNVGWTAPAGIYVETVTVTDANKATSSIAVTITVNSPLSITMNTRSLTTTLGVGGTLPISITGGTGTVTTTLDSSCSASPYLSISNTQFQVLAKAPIGAYSCTITATDSSSPTPSTAITSAVFAVNRYPIIFSQQYQTDGGLLNLDGTNAGPATSTTWSNVGSKSGSDAALYNSPTYSGSVTGYYTFNGSSQLGIIPAGQITSSSNPLINFTIDAWINLSSYPSYSSSTSTPAIIEECRNSTLSINGLTNTCGSNINFAIWPCVTSATPSSYSLDAGYFDPTNGWNKADGSNTQKEAGGSIGGGLKLNTWYFVTYTVSGSGPYVSTLKINNTTVLTGSRTWAPQTSGSQIYIGRGMTSADYLNGSIGQVDIYNRVLAPAEIVQNYDNGVIRFANNIAGGSGSMLPLSPVSYVSVRNVTSSVANSVSSYQTTVGMAATISDQPNYGSGTFSYGISGTSGPTVSSDATGLFTVTYPATLTAGIYSDTVTATDAVGASTSIGFNLTINPVVSITGSTSLATTSGATTAVTSSYAATNGSGSISWGLSPTTSGITISGSGTLSVSGASLNPGTINESVTATDSLGAVTYFPITITVNSAPSLIGPSSLTTTSGNALTSQSYSFGGGTGALSVSLDATSTGTYHESITNLQSTSLQLLIPATTVATNQTNTVTFTIRDSLGASNTFTTLVTITAPIRISGTTTITKVYGETVSQSFTASNGSGTIEFGATGSSAACPFISSTSGSYTVEQIAAASSCTWNPPAGPTSISWMAVGGGGGGGGGSFATSDGARGGGGGGGGGQFASGTQTITSGAPMTVTVGGGGIKGTNNNGSGTVTCATGATDVATYGCAGGNGGGSSISYNSTSVASVSGGTGGGTQTATDQNTSAGNGGNSGSNNGGLNCWEGAGGGAGSNGGTAANNSHCASRTTYPLNGDDIGGPGGDGGNGGVGTQWSINSAYYGGGGGGGGTAAAPSSNTVYISTPAGYYGTAGTGGTGGGGAGSTHGCGTSAACTSNGTTPAWVSVAAGAANATIGTGGGGGGGSGPSIPNGNTLSTGGPWPSTDGGYGSPGVVGLAYLTSAVTDTTSRITMSVTGQTAGSASTLLTVPANVTVGSYTEVLTAGDLTGNSAGSITIAINVTKATPTVTLSVPNSATSAVYGTAIVLSAQASISGSFTFSYGGTAITSCSGVTTSGVNISTCSWTPSALNSVGAALTAAFTPGSSYTANYNSNSATVSNFTVTTAPNLTIYGATETMTYNASSQGSGTFTTSGLVGFDQVNSVTLTYSGTANDGTTYSASTTKPTKAGTYTVTPSVPVGKSAQGTTNASASFVTGNYSGITFTPGTLTIVRAPISGQLSYGDTNTATTTYNSTPGYYNPILLFTYETGVPSMSYSSDNTNVCTVNSSSGALSALAAGTCNVTLNIGTGNNYQSATIVRQVTVNRASRTITLTSSASLLKYGDTATITSAITPSNSYAQNEGVLSYSLASTSACTFNSSTMVVTATGASGTCSITASVTQGDHYLSTTSAAPTLSFTTAPAPAISYAALTGVSYTGSPATFVLTPTISGLLFNDALGGVTAVYTGTNGTTYGPSTSAPTQGGSYLITPSAWTLSTGSTSNYGTPTYTGVAANIGPIAQSALVDNQSMSAASTPFQLGFTGGNTTGATYSVDLVHSTASGCTVNSNGVLNALSQGTCIITITLPATSNYTAATLTITVTVAQYYNYAAAVVVSSGGPQIGGGLANQGIVSSGPAACSSACAPTITSFQSNTGATITSALSNDFVTIIGSGFMGATLVRFGRGAITSIVVNSDTSVTFQVPNGTAVGSYQIKVQAPGGLSAGVALNITG